MEPYKLTPQELRTLNSGLEDLAVIMSDVETAKAAGVPGMDELQEACDLCQRRIVAYKAAYAKDQK